MKIITSALITLIASAALANDPHAAPAATTTEAAPKVASAPTETECKKNPKMEGCKEMKKEHTKKTK